MLVVVAAAFVILRAPYTVAWFLLHYQSDLFQPLTYRIADQLRVAINITYIFTVTNYASNFFFYSLSGTQFRASLRALFQKPDRSVAYGTDSLRLSHPSSETTSHM